MKRSIYELCVSAMAVMLLLNVNSVIASNYEDAPDSLFFITDESNVDRDAIDTNSTVVDKRPIEINTPLIYALRDSILDQFVIPTINGESHVAEINKRVIRDEGDFSLIGVFSQPNQGYFSLSYKGDIIVGNLHVKNKLFQLRTNFRGLQELVEIDSYKFPPCATGKRHRVTSMPSDNYIYSKHSDNSVNADDGSVFDIMVVYTPAARDAVGGTNSMEAWINVAIDETNSAYDNSQINSDMRLVHQQEVDYTEVDFDTDLDNLTDTNDGNIDNIHNLRDTYGADFVCMLIDDDTYCGLAWTMTNLSSNFEDKAFSVVHWDCATSYYSLAHEVGHNMGCHHAVGDSGLTQGEGLYNYSHGWRFNGTSAGNPQYRTIMAYAPGTRIDHFSNPNISYDGTATGVAINEDNAAYNALDINNVAYTVSNFRDSTNYGITNISPGELVINEWGEVKIEVVAIEDNEYYVRVWDDDGWTAPEWEWSSVSSNTVSLSAAQTHTFTLYTKPDNESEGFEFWLYKKDLFGLYQVIDKVEFILDASEVDNQSPSVSNLSVKQNGVAVSYGSDVHDIVQVEASLYDNHGISQSVLYVDGQQEDSIIYLPPISGSFTENFGWDTTLYNDGPHTVTFGAWDSSGNLTIYQPEFNVNVDNATPDHDFALTTISTNPLYPEDDELTQVIGTVRNIGRSTEASGVMAQLYVDGFLANTRYTTISLASGQEEDLYFDWYADNGLHELKAQVYLTGDQNSSNDGKTLPIGIGYQGELLVNGQSSVSLNYTGIKGSQISTSVDLYNRGGTPLTVNIAKSGAISSWISLSSTTESVWNGTIKIYPFTINIPSGASNGTYTGTITFNYPDGSIPVLLNVQVVDSTPGQVDEVFTTSSVLIDGAYLDSDILFHGSNFYLDNDNATSDLHYREEEVDIDAQEFSRIQSATFSVSDGTEILDLPPNDLRLRGSTNSIQAFTYSDSFSGQYNYNIFDDLYIGLNRARISLDIFTHGAADAKWRVGSSHATISYSKSAWGDYKYISTTDLNNFDTSWNYGRIYASVQSVENAGDVHLYIAKSANGQGAVKRKTIAIDSSDIDDEVYWSISPSYLDNDNYFMLKGDGADDTKVTLSNIRLEIRYYLGEPAIQGVKTLSADEILKGQSTTVNMTFDNIGANRADEITYNDSPLPTGLTHTGGSLSADIGNMHPDDYPENASYTLRGDTPGIYSFGDTVITFENRDGSQTYQSSFNAVTLTVLGGDLVIEGNGVSTTVLEKYSPVGIYTKVQESLGGTYITDAQVVAEITKPSSDTDQTVLFYNPTNSRYEGQYNGTDQYGPYAINYSANKPLYNEGTDVISSAFTVVGPPALSVTPNNYDFEGVYVGESNTRTFTVINIGGSTLTGSAVAQSPYSIQSGSSYSIEPLQSQEVIVSFEPNEPGVFIRSVQFTGGGTVSRAVYGYTPDYKITIDPDSLQLAPGSQVTTTVNLESINGFNREVTLACNDLPDEVTVSFSANPIIPNGSTLATFEATTSASTISILPEISTFGGGINHALPFLLQVHPDTLIISGYIQDLDGLPIGNIEVNTNDGQTTLTSCFGYYEYTVPYGWSGSIAPSSTLHAFNPDIRTYESLYTDLANQDFTASSIGEVVYVNDDAGGLNLGTNWENAFTDLQDALGQARYSDGLVREIWVAKGKYKPTTPNGARNISFELVDGVQLLGGFEGLEFSSQQRNPWKNQTILTGDLNDNDISNGDISDNTYHVVIGTGSASTIIDGFTITGGNATNSEGGGLLNDGCNPCIKNCIFIENHGTNGAGVANIYSSSPSFENCIFASNVAYNLGGAMQNYINCNPSIISCTFINNEAEYGGGIYSLVGSPVINSSIFWNNSDIGGYDESAQIHTDSGSPAINYSCVQGLTGGLGGAGNIWDIPMFNSIANNDCHLEQCSPCVDSGDPSLALSNEPWPNGQRINMGAYGNTVEACHSQANLDQLTIFIENWMSHVSTVDIAPLPSGDNNVNLYDFAKLCQLWLICQ